MSPFTKHIRLIFFIYLCFVNSQCDSIEIQSDVIIGGIFPVSRKEINGSSEVSTVTDKGIQRLEAMLFAIDKLNSDQFIPGIQFRPQIIDSFDDKNVALKESLKFIETSFQQNESSKLIGVVGASRSVVTMRIVQLLQLFQIPTITYASTASSLADFSRYSLFARTVSSDLTHAVIMANIANYFNWTYVSIIGSEFTSDVATRFTREGKIRGYCVATIEMLPKNPNEDNCRHAIHNLIAKNNAKAVFVFLNSKDFNCILGAAYNLQLHKHFIWITSYFMEAPFFIGLGDNADNVLSIENSDSKTVNEFQEYFTNLRSNDRNRWFEEYLRIKPLHYTQEPKVLNVINSVYAFANAFKKAWIELCSGKPGMCEDLRKLSGDEFFFKYVININFTDINGNYVEFNGNEVIEEFNIIQFRTDSNVFGKPSGKWNKDGLEIKEFKWNNGTPVSVCSFPCPKGHRKVVQAGDTCCWICLKCTQNEYLVDEYSCKACPDGYKPNDNQTKCQLNDMNGITTQKPKVTGASIKSDENIERGSCSDEMKQLKCRISHLEHNLLPLKYELPKCSYNRN